VSTSTSDNALRDALVLEPVGDHAWRICDGRVRVGEGRFVAFVEEKLDGYEVMQLAGDFVWTSFPTLETALSHVVDTDGECARSRAIGDLGWIR
jgi:hypothetical protein